VAGKAIRPAERREAAASIHRASASASIGRVAELRTEVEITSGGLLAVGALVSAILLSTAVIVRTAVGGRRARRLREEPTSG
jgi:hypothetical protein